mgnify:CR=1 FL=1
MANVCWVPFDYIENKGQQIKVHSQLLYEAKLNDYKVPTVGYKDTDDEFSFTGATVQEPKKGAYFQEITGLDFASLYPSIMIANNYSYETMVKSEKYWKINIKYVKILLTIWFVFSFLFGIILKDFLNEFSIAGFKLGFWFAQQGSIYIFVILIFVYVYLMNKLDIRFGVQETEEGS